MKSLVDKCKCGGDHIVLYCPVARTQTAAIFFKMKNTENPVTKSVYREMLVSRIQNGDY